MPATVNSASSAYASGTDLVEARDWRAVGDLIKDDNTRPASSGAVAVATIVTTALKNASGQIEMAATAGARYQPEDLSALAAGSTVGGAALKGLTCDLAFWWLSKRRKPGARPEDVAGVPEALDCLDRLRNGERIFPFTETQEAGLADVVALEEGLDVREAAEPLSERASRFFGSRR